MASSSAQFLRVLAAALLQDRRTIIILLIALGLMAGAQSMLLVLFKGFLVAIFGTTSDFSLFEVLPGQFAKHLPKSFNQSLSRDDLVFWVPVMILATGLVKAAATYYYQWNQQALVLAAARSLRQRIFRSLLSLNFERLKERSAGSWMSVIMNDVFFLQIRFADCLTTFVKDTVLILACILVLSMIHLPSALFLLCLAPLIALGMGRGAKRIAFFAERWQMELAKIAAKVLDLRKRFDFIKAQRGESLELKAFERLNVGYYRMIRRSLVVRAAFAPAIEFIGLLIFAGFVFATAKGLFGKDLDGGIILQFFVALGLIVKPLRDFGEQMARLSETKGALARTLEIVGDGKPPVTSEASTDLPDLIEIETLTIAYDVGARSGVRQIPAREAHFSYSGLTIGAGARIALVGPSGAGKTTLIRALGGLLEPSDWRANVEWQCVVGASSLVSQHPFLFSDTLRANLTYANPHDVDEQAMWDALKAVALDEVVSLLPMRLETSFKALHQSLSGGQIQRLTVARALLRNPSLLILDEATAALDVAGEALLFQQLFHWTYGARRLLVITHRLANIAVFDHVWFAQDSTTLLCGTHSQLMDNQRYRDFYLASEHA